MHGVPQFLCCGHAKPATFILARRRKQDAVRPYLLVPSLVRILESDPFPHPATGWVPFPFHGRAASVLGGRQALTALGSPAADDRAP